MEVPGDTPETDERCRSIERGGRLVGVMPSTFAVTLQMPRGNIETIYPRALVLAGVRTFIDRKNYRSAFLACRSQMVDMNILHDYAPQQFMDNIPLFIDQVKRIDFIDDFISRLRYAMNYALLIKASTNFVQRGRCLPNPLQRYVESTKDRSSSCP